MNADKLFIPNHESLENVPNHKGKVLDHDLPLDAVQKALWSQGIKATIVEYNAAKRTAIIKSTYADYILAKSHLKKKDIKVSQA